MYIYDACVFVSKIAAGMGRAGDSYGNNIVSTVEDKTRTIVYTGELENPSTWRKLSEYERQVKVLDQRI